MAEALANKPSTLILTPHPHCSPIPHPPHPSAHAPPPPHPHCSVPHPPHPSAHAPPPPHPQVAEALTKGGSINGCRPDAECVISLDLRNNFPLRSANVLAKVLTQLPALRSLNCSGCLSLQGLPPLIADLSPTLTELDLHGCGSMAYLPEAITALTTLTTLSLGSGLKALPPDLGRLASLRVLHAANLCVLERLPPTFAHLTSLEEAHLSGWSSLRELPDDLFGLPRLRLLALGCRPQRAPLTALPATIGRLAPTLEVGCMDMYVHVCVQLPSRVS